MQISKDITNVGANDRELKQECIKRLEILKFDEKVIEDFKSKDKLYATNISNRKLIDTAYNELIKGIKAFEKTNNIKIYHIVNIETNNNMVVYLLFVKRNKREWKNERVDLRNGFAEVYSYEENRNFKHIGIETKAGKIVKVV